VGAAQDGYRNPVIPGFHPDPSVCRVGDDFYLVTSSFEYFPGVPIFHSKDLVHWEQIGHCLTRDSQLPLDSCPASAGIFAPTLRYHEGTFYMITTNVSGGGTFLVTTTDPAGEWSEPMWTETGGIDPDLFFEDGKVYVTSTDGLLGLGMCEIDPSTGARLTELRHIWRGTGGRYAEGPHVYKKDGLYYLMISEGGTEYGHKVTIARSRELMGPYRSNPANPILTHADELTQTSQIQGTGHADLVQAPDGSWWMVCLAFRPALGRHHIMGRETFLAPVVWNDNSWPVVNGNGTIALEMKVPTLPLHPFDQPPPRTEFSEPFLGLEWNYLRNPVRGDYSLTERPGYLALQGTEVSLDQRDTPTFVGRRQEHFAFEAVTVVEFSPAAATDEAGLAVLMNDTHHYKLAVTREDGYPVLKLAVRLGSFSFTRAQAPLEPGPVTLVVTGSREAYTFAYAQGDDELTVLGQGDTYLLSTETAGGFTGVYLGLYTTGNGARPRSRAYFDSFEYRPFEDRG